MESSYLRSRTLLTSIFTTSTSRRNQFFVGDSFFTSAKNEKISFINKTILFKNSIVNTIFPIMTSRKISTSFIFYSPKKRRSICFWGLLGCTIVTKGTTVSKEDADPKIFYLRFKEELIQEIVKKFGYLTKRYSTEDIKKVADALTSIAFEKMDKQKKDLASSSKNSITPTSIFSEYEEKLEYIFHGDHLYFKVNKEQVKKLLSFPIDLYDNYSDTQSWMNNVDRRYAGIH